MYFFLNYLIGDACNLLVVAIETVQQIDGENKKCSRQLPERP